MQLIDLIETYAYGTSEDLIKKKEKTKRGNIIGQHKNIQHWLYYKRRQKNIIQNGQKFLIIYIE